MSRTKRGIFVAATLLLVTVLISGCQQPYSTPPAVTNTPIDTNSLFTTPIPNEPGSMQDVENISTQTAAASLASPTPNANGAQATATIDILAPTATVTLAVIVPPTATSIPASVPSGPKPGTYTLKRGEFPYCIARRFNVDPDALLQLSGLSSGILYPPGTTLTIPQSGSFPDGRMLKNHPTTYTVLSSDETVYSVACLFGDLDPASIAQANNISADAALTSGQTLNIP